MGNIAALRGGLYNVGVGTTVGVLNNGGIRIVSLHSNRPVSVSNKATTVARTIGVAIPNMVRVRLSPTGISIDTVRARVTRRREIVGDVLNECGMRGLRTLRRLTGGVAATGGGTRGTASHLTVLLNSAAFRRLETGIPSSTHLDSSVRESVVTIYNDSSVIHFVGDARAGVRNCADRCVDVSGLGGATTSERTRCSGTTRTLGSTSSVPARFLAMDSPSACLTNLRDSLRSGETTHRSTLAEGTGTADELRACGRGLADSPGRSGSETRQTFGRIGRLLSR